MEKIAVFHKVNKNQFMSAVQNEFSCRTKEEISDLYDSIKLPVRAGNGSAGYDFHTLFDVVLYPGTSIIIPTGISVELKEGWMLKLFPINGLGFKYRIEINNIGGIIDSGYFYENAQGIVASVLNDSRNEKPLVISKDAPFIQGIFIPYGIAADNRNV